MRKHRRKQGKKPKKTGGLRGIIQDVNPFDQESGDARRRARQHRIDSRQSTKKAKIEAKAESGYWSPEAVASRQSAWSSVASTGLQTAGAVASGALGGGFGDLLGGLTGSSDGETGSSSTSSGSSGDNTMLIVGAVVIAGVILLSSSKKKGG